MKILVILIALLLLTAVLICYSACVVSSRENYVPRDYYEAVVEELCRKHTEEIASMPDIVFCKECKYRGIGIDGTFCERRHEAFRVKPDDFCSYGERASDE